MGFRFRRSVKIAPGVKLNLGKKSTSITVGGKAIRTTFSSTGKITRSMSTPIKGLTYVETIRPAQKDNESLYAEKVKKPSLSYSPKGQYKISGIIMKLCAWLIIPVGILLIIGGQGTAGGFSAAIGAGCAWLGSHYNKRAKMLEDEETPTNSQDQRFPYTEKYVVEIDTEEQENNI